MSALRAHPAGNIEHRVDVVLIGVAVVVEVGIDVGGARQENAIRAMQAGASPGASGETTKPE